jgi:hypothetical protein
MVWSCTAQGQIANLSNMIRFNVSSFANSACLNIVDPALPRQPPGVGTHPLVSRQTR